MTYEPSSLLKKSRPAVVLITGADLVLVKMQGVRRRVEDSADADSAAAPAAAGAVGAAAAAAAAAMQAEFSAAAMSAVDDARASVLAQHELNKVCAGCRAGCL